MKRVAAIVLLLLVAVAPTQAQSPVNFDCAKASAPVERAICGDMKLKLADNMLSSAYHLLLARLEGPARELLQKDRARWLANRDTACTQGAVEIVHCLKQRIEARQAFLRVPGEGTFPFVSDHALIESGHVGAIRYFIDASYPQFDGTQADFGPINRIFSDGAKIAAAEATPDAKADTRHAQTWSYGQSFRLHRPGPDAVSVVLQSYVFAGGAHGDTKSAGWLVDRRTGRPLFADDLFADGDAWRARLRELVTASLKKHFVERPGFEDALQPTKMDEMLRQLLRYLWRSDGLSILFNRYDIAAGVMGDYLVRIPYAELKPLLRPDAPVGR